MWWTKRGLPALGWITRALLGEKYGATQPDVEMFPPPVRWEPNSCARHTYTWGWHTQYARPGRCDKSDNTNWSLNDHTLSFFLSDHIPRALFTKKRTRELGPVEWRCRHGVRIYFVHFRFEAHKKMMRKEGMISWVSKTQPNHWTKRMVNTRLAT